MSSWSLTPIFKRVLPRERGGVLGGGLESDMYWEGLGGEVYCWEGVMTVINRVCGGMLLD